MLNYITKYYKISVSSILLLYRNRKVINYLINKENNNN